MSERNIFSDFNLSTFDHQDNETLWRQAILDKVVWYLAHDKELLMSYLYRMDVIESKIYEALHHPSLPIDEAIAALILERQKQRLTTKKNIKVEPIDDNF